MAQIRSDSTLAELIKKMTQPGPSLTVEQARQIGRGTERVLRDRITPSDPITLADWAFRVIPDANLGPYTTPSVQLFEDMIISGSGYVSTTYSGTNGNISMHVSNEDPYLAMHTAEVFVSEPSGILGHIGIDTSHSLWIGVDGTGVVGTSPYGPNQFTDAWLSLPSGVTAIDIGVYTPGGDVDYEFFGDLALQVDCQWMT
jgi:hypothetical protein